MHSDVLGVQSSSEGGHLGKPLLLSVRPPAGAHRTTFGCFNGDIFGISCGNGYFFSQLDPSGDAGASLIPAEHGA